MLNIHKTKAFFVGAAMTLLMTATTFAAISGEYKAPTRAGYEFLGWYLNPEGTGDMVIDKDGNWLRDFDDNARVYAKWREAPDFKFAVSIYDIGIDKDRNGNLMGLTIGPAMNCAITSYVSHTVDDSGNITGSDAGITTADASLNTNGGNPYRCFHQDPWDTIIAWNGTDPHVYDKCIAHNCTHSVGLFQTGSLLNTNFHPSYGEGDGPGALFYELWHGDTKYLQWSIDNSHLNWAQSQTRAILNGPDENTTETVVTNAIKNDVALIDCFPAELQDAIGERAVQYALTKDCCDTTTGVHRGDFGTVYDKLWGASIDEIYGEVPLRHADGHGDLRRFYTPSEIGESGRLIGQGQYQKTRNYNLQFQVKTSTNNWQVINQEKVKITVATDGTYNNTQTQDNHRRYINLRSFSNDYWSCPYKPWKAYIQHDGQLGAAYGHPQSSSIGSYAGTGVWFCLKRQ